MKFAPALLLAAAAATAQAQESAAMDHAAMDHTAMDHTAMGHGNTDASAMPTMMSGMLGPYPMAREASGTSWQPDATPMDGIHAMHGDWMTMVHGYANLVYDHQGGPRGDKQAFTESMFMAMAQRPLGDGTLGLRAMFSLDPTIGKRGYPLLFQTGETADGVHPLVDRQHPHDLFMELAATYSRRLDGDSAVFLYGGLPGEPALGPVTYMHRYSGQDNPEAPLTHHWLDSTHITFGVLTAGYVRGGVKLEASAFNGREPDQYRWNIETRRLDSASARLSWNPTPEWALQVSHGRLDSPEQLEPNVAVHRTTASASWQHAIDGRPMQTTLAWGRNRHDPGDSSDGYLLESTIEARPGTKVFGRFEQVDNGELFEEASPLHHRQFDVRKLSVGVVQDLFRAGDVAFSAGVLGSRHWAPATLDAFYGNDPSSYMVFFRARLAMK
ncbi:LPS-assembly protein LptD [Massilia forsythiae]|uniref:LPS-assembly protein LptD n=1 Tax=Massilia forsythiae TaxID=2728020 RepID=A0A7Z2ZRK7_9BURK|nr:hypothetical protein [Massilia forsythiae]QJD99154.1 LPS-assembly protein LptD [Massilia forsythiae]